MLRLDSSEMLPGSQKGENRGRHFDSSRKCVQRIGTGNDHVTPRDVNSRVSLIDILCPCENGESQHVTYPDGKRI